MKFMASSQMLASMNVCVQVAQQPRATEYPEGNQDQRAGCFRDRDNDKEDKPSPCLYSRGGAECLNSYADAGFGFSRTINNVALVSGQSRHSAEKSARSIKGDNIFYGTVILVTRPHFLQTKLGEPGVCVCVTSCKNKESRGQCPQNVVHSQKLVACKKDKGCKNP